MDKIYHDGQKSLNITLNFKLCDYYFMNIDNITFYVLQIFSDTFAQFTTLIIYFLSGTFFFQSLKIMSFLYLNIISLSSLPVFSIWRFPILCI